VRQKTLIDVGALTALLAIATCAVSAQAPSRRASITVGTGIIISPRLPGDCGGGAGGLEAKGGLILRPLRRFLVEAAVKTADLWIGDCAGTAKEVDTTYVDVWLTPNPYLMSSLKLGYETPASLPLFRFTAGAGVLSGGRPRGLAVFGVAWSTRGPRGRTFVEVERTQTKVRGVERHYDLRTQQLKATVPFRTRASMQSVRIGMEWPLSGGER
jgi:hypothetical protein